MTQSAHVLDSAASQAFARLEQAAHDAATSPWNLRKHPTTAQQLANNYYKGRFELRKGLPVKIDNARGTVRTGTSPDGTTWANRMAAHYGDFTGTKGADGDAVDVFLGPFPESPRVWVINQRRTWGDRGFDEHKVMAGFHTEAQARDAYLGSYDRGWDGLESIVPCTFDQLKWWLRSGDCTARFTTDTIPHEGTIMDNAVLWDGDANPVGIPMHQLVYGLRRADADNLLLDSTTMADLMTDPDIEGVITLDALVVEVSRLSQKMTMLQKVMVAAGGAVKPTDFTISDPVRARGVLQVMVLFQMDDGQTISIWFHNPDTTPAKLTPLDELVSWKWMLNKKDVTIVVAPERGQDLNVREVSRRVMKLVERNSDAFKRANAKAAERVKAIEDIKSEITVLEVELSDWQRKIEIAQMERDEAPTPKERWDSARGHAAATVRALKEELMDASTSPRSGAAADTYQLALNVLVLANKYATGEVASGSPEELRSLIDEKAVEIRALLIEAAKAPAPVEAAPEPVSAAAPAVADAGDTALAALVTPDDMAAIRYDGGYLAVRADEKLSLKWQDVLDSALQQRIVDVRNALRTLGWVGKGLELQRTFSGSVHSIKAVTKNVGAGSNVVGVQWSVDAGTVMVDDTLTMTPADMASYLDTQLASTAGEPSPLPVPDNESDQDRSFREWRENYARVSGADDLNTVSENDIERAINFASQQVARLGPGKAWEGDEQAKKLIDAYNREIEQLTFHLRNRAGTRRNAAQAAAAYDLQAGIAQAEAAGGTDFAAGAIRTPAESTALAAIMKGSGNDAPKLTDAWLRGWDAGKAAEMQPEEPASTGSPTDAALQAAAEAGAEVNRISRNLADLKGTADLPKATLSTADRSVLIFLYTDADVARAVKAVHDAEEMSHFKAFDPSTLKMPTAVQLGLNTSNTLVLPVSDKDSGVVLDGWSNGHLMDFTQRPALVTKAIAKYHVDERGAFIRRIPQSKIEKIEMAAKSRGVQVKPISNYDYEQTVVDAKKAKTGKAMQTVPVNSLVLESDDGKTWVWLDTKYVAYFWKTYKGCEFFADGPEASVAVRYHGKLVGVIMPMNAKGDTSIIARAKRSKAKELAAQEPDALTPAAVDAAYQFAEATDAFKIAVAHSVAETDYSAFLTSRNIDERAKALGLSVSWDVQSVVLDSAGLFADFQADAALSLVDGPRERVLDALVLAATPYLPAGAVLDFVGDVPAAVAQIQGVLDAQPDLDAGIASQLRNAVHFLAAGRTLDDAGDAGGEESETVVGTIKRGGAVIGRAVVMDGDGKAMIYLGAAGTQRVTFISKVDGERRAAMWSEDDAGEMVDWLVENVAESEAAAQAAIAAAPATPINAAAQAAVEAAPGPAAGLVTRTGIAAQKFVDSAREQFGLTAEQADAALAYYLKNKLVKLDALSGQFTLKHGAFWEKEPLLRAANGGGQPPVEPPAAPPVADEPGEPASLFEGRAALDEIGHFMPSFQRRFIKSAMAGEEGQWFIDKMIEMRDLIKGMPKVYEQDGKGGAAIVYLHYFTGGIDSWITERDSEFDEQAQAYGMQDIGHGPSLGYISIEEITQAGAELDLHWTPKTIGEIRGDDAADEAATGDDDSNIGRSWRSPSGAMEVVGFNDATGKYRTQVDGEQPGLEIDPDDLEQTIRDDERAVAETEAETLAARQASENAPMNTLRPLTPQSPDRIQWEGEVARIMGETLDVTNSDAQAMMEARPDDLDVAFTRGDAPAAVVAALWPADPTAFIVEGSGVVQPSPFAGSGDLGQAGAEWTRMRELERSAILARIGAPAGIARTAWSDIAIPWQKKLAAAMSEPTASAAAPAADPAKDADRTYLQTLIDGTADMLDPGVFERIEPMFTKYESDADMMDVLTRAADAYSNAATAAAKQALAG